MYLLFDLYWKQIIYYYIETFIFNAEKRDFDDNIFFLLTVHLSMCLSTNASMCVFIFYQYYCCNISEGSSVRIYK